MRVAVTGGTGFVGSHTVAALVAAGHQVRLLVRDPAKVELALGPLKVPAENVGVVVGSVTDEQAVREVLDGVDACLHAAAVVATRRREMGEVEATNLRGAENVLGTAAELGLDPIVHVSSVGAVFPSPTGVLSADLPVIRPKSRYGQTKADCETFARRLQEKDVPVVIVYPGGVTGPHDVGLNAVAAGFLRFLQLGVFPVVRTGGVLLVDVRDLAQVHERTLRPGLGPRRFMAGGHYLAWEHAARLFEAAGGRTLRKITVPGGLLRAVGHMGDLVAHLLRVDFPLDYETAYYMTRLSPSDDHAVAGELGVSWRSPAETVNDLVAWMMEAGHLVRH